MEVGIWAILGVVIAGQFTLWAMLLRLNNGLRKELAEILAEINKRLGRIEGLLEEHLRRHG